MRGARGMAAVVDGAESGAEADILALNWWLACEEWDGTGAGCTCLCLYDA